MKGRIKVGAKIGHDFSFYRWPYCKAPGGKEKADDENMLFEMKPFLKGVMCTGPGYGAIGNYGNGSIYVWGSNND